jgi:hypothetical protein
MTNLTYQQGKLERITRKWWFFVLFVLIQFIPPYASKGYKFPEEWGSVISHAIGKAVIYSHSFRAISNFQNNSHHIVDWYYRFAK